MHSLISAVAAGTMLHLVVEACIARNLIDTSAYFWPGYVASLVPSKNSTLVHESPWSTFMDGAQLTDSLKNSLIETPASRFPSLKPLVHYHSYVLCYYWFYSMSYLCFYLALAVILLPGNIILLQRCWTWKSVPYCNKWVWRRTISCCKDSKWCISHLWLEYSGTSSIFVFLWSSPLVWVAWYCIGSYSYNFASELLN